MNTAAKAQAPDITSTTAVSTTTPKKAQRVIYAQVYGYSSDVSQTDDTPFLTASGQHVRDGIVANNCLPFGTKVSIHGRTYVVQDRMNSRYGCSYFDVWVSSAKLARTFKADVTVLE